MRTFLTFIIAALISSTAISQENSKEFKPSGNPFIKVYTNLHSSMSDGNTFNAFEIQRAYFGYAYQMSEKFSGKLNIDVGNPGVGDLQMTAYLKNAYFRYKSGKLTTKFGLIGSSQFKLQEDLWGGRYLYKSFMDEHEIGPSADLAMNVSYKLNDIFNVDITVANGEGYKKLEADSVFKYSAGVTVRPFEGMDFRASYDVMGKEDPQQTISFYSGYTAGRFNFGAEYIRQLNHQVNPGEHLSGISFFSSYEIKKTRIFARFDQLSSDMISTSTDPWNYKKDGQLVIAGVEFNPVKGIRITPNYQGWMPENGDAFIHIAYLSCEIKF